MSKDNDFFGGFANIAGEISPHVDGGPADLPDDGKVTDASQASVATVDPEDILADDDVTPLGQEEDLEVEEQTENPTDTGEESESEEDSEEGAQEQEEEEESEIESDPSPQEVQDTPTDEEVDLGEVEADITGYFTGKLAEALGVDVDEEDKFESANDLVDFMRDLVETNSKPIFASEDIEKLNEFVEDGGNLKEYFDTQYGGVDADSIDLSSESNQKAVIKELLKAEGYSDNRISKRIERYEEAGTLEEEAEDAKELLVEHRQKEAEKLLVTQQKNAQVRREQQQKLVSDVQSSIKALKDVRGIPVSETERKQLLNYVFATDEDGLTQYQKDYSKDVANLIESAYFTMKGDALVQKIQSKATSNAVKNIKTKLESKGKRTKSVRGQEETSDLDVLVQASKLLRKR